jgi:colanic acid/amylovoran biosynthesis protein
LLPPDTLQSAYGTVDYFIGTRMHSVILALNAGTPVLAIGYLHKTRGVLDALMLGDSCLDIGSISATQLISALERLRASPEQPGVAPYLERSRRLKRALGQLLLSIR